MIHFKRFWFSNGHSDHANEMQVFINRLFRRPKSY